MFESTLRIHFDPSVSSTYTSPASPSGLMAPSNVLPSFKYRFRMDMSSTIISPSIFCDSAVRLTLPPFDPSFPHPAEAARKNTPSPLFVISTPDKDISVAVLFTKNISPLAFVMLPPVAENFESPVSASPDMDWYIITALKLSDLSLLCWL